MNNKSQSAMEYLMTYGWAILVVLIALGALFYLGVFNPKTPNTCQLNTPFVCIGGDVLGTNNAALTPDTLVFKVAAQGSITSPTITSIIIDGTERIASCTPPVTMTPGVEKTVTCSLDGLFSAAGKKFSGTITATYVGDAGTHTTSGTFSGTTE